MPGLLRRTPPLALPAYDQCLKASHLFNLLDARGVISVTERAAYIGRVRALARACCEAWLRARGHLAARAGGLSRWRSCCSSCCRRRSRRACSSAPPTISASWSAARSNGRRAAVRADLDLRHAAPAGAGGCAGSPRSQADVEVEQRGPGSARRRQALDGFIGSLGVSDYALEERDEKRGKVHVARYVRAAASPPPRCWCRCSARSWRASPGPSRCAGARTAIRWVRPLKSILCLLDGAVVPVDVRSAHGGRADRAATAFSRPAPLEVRDFEDYRQKLRAAYVQLDGAERQKEIASEAAELARAESLALRDDPGLLAELAGLVEWPVVLLGRIDERFMALPEEVLVTSMRQHQKYLALEDQDGRLAPQLPGGRQPAGGGRRRGDRRRQRARAAGAAVGRPVLLGPGLAGGRSRAACRRSTAWCSTPGSARSAPRSRACRASRPGSPSACPARRSSTRRARRCCARPTSSPAWSASSPSCRA